MPILDQQKRLRLIDLGLDPDQYEEFGEAETSPQEQPSMAPTPKMEQPSPITSYRQEFIRNAPAATAGLAATGLFSKLPIPPYAKIPLSIGAGIGTSIGTRIGQDLFFDAVLPESWNQQYKQSQQINREANPLSSTLGGATAGLVALKPDPKSVVTAGKALVKPFRGGVLTGAEKNALLNVGTGAAIPPGITYAREAYNQGTPLPELPIGEMLIDAATGSVINNPNKIGQKLGLTPNTYDPEPLKGIAKRHKTSSPIEKIPDDSDLQYQAEYEAQPYVQELRARQTEVENKKKYLKEFKELKRNEYEVNKQLEAEKGVEQMDAQREAESLAKARQDDKIQQENETRRKDFIAAKVEELQSEPPNLPKTESIPKPLITTEAGKEIFPDYTGTVEADINENQTKPLSDAEQIQSEYDSGKRSQTKSSIEKLQEGAKTKGISFSPSKAWRDALTKLGVIRGVETKNEVIKGADQVSELAGESELRSGLQKAISRINPNKAKVDTWPHELFHIFRKDLKTLGGNADRVLISKADSAIKASPEFKDWFNKLSPDSPYRKGQDPIEEFLTAKVGEDFVRRHLIENSSFKNALSDIWSNVKVKYGKATPEDYSRLFSYRLSSDPSFSERYGVLQAKTNVGELENSKRSQEESQIPASGSKGIAPVIYKGAMENPKTGFKLHLYDLTDDIKDPKTGEILHPKGSTVSQNTLVKNNLEIPKDMPQNPEVRGQEESRLEDRSKEIPGHITAHGNIEPILSFDRVSTRLSEYIEFLRDVKKFNDDQVADAIGNLTRASGNIEGEIFPKRMAPQIRVEQNKTQFKSRLSDDSNLVDDESRINAAKSPVDLDTLPISSFDAGRLPGLNLLRSNIDKVKDKASPELAKGLSSFYDTQMNLTGKILNKFSNNVRSVVDLDGVIKALINNPKGYLTQDTPEFNNVVKYFHAHADGETLPTLSEKEQVIVDVWKDTSKQVRDEQRLRMSKDESDKGLRKIFEDDPMYFPHRASLDVVEELTQRPLSDKSKSLKKDFIDYQTKKLKSEKEAKENYETLINSFNKRDLDLASQFGPIDKAQGVGLPKSWRDKSFLNTTQHYLDRVIRRFSYFDNIQKAGLEDQVKTYKDVDSVKPVLDDIRGNRHSDNPTTMAVEGLIKGGLLGTLTGGKDFLGAATLAFQHQQNPIKAITGSLKGLMDLKQSIVDAAELGRIRQHMNVLEWDGGYSDSIRNLRRGRDILSDLSGRNFLDQAARGWAMAQGKHMAIGYHQDYLNGNLDKQGEKFFKDFADGINWKKEDLTLDDVKQIAARVVDSSQGTYDYRGLPDWTMQGSLAPWFALGRWSIEKSNNFIKNVVNPAINDNNWMPFLNATVGMVLGGAATTALIEGVTGRKQKTATIKEIQDASKRGKDVNMAVAYKMMGLATAAGHIGFVGDIVKGIMDVTYGKNRPQTVNNVLFELAENTANTTGNLIKSISDYGYDNETMMNAANQILEDNFQAYRILESQLGSEKKEDIELANKLRDLRVFNTLEGNAIRDMSSPFSRTVEDRKLRKFKRATTLKEVEEVLPELIQRALKKADGNVEKFTKEMSRIKRNTYQTMPSPDKWPLTSKEYYLFLTRTQGTEKASERVMDYIRRNEINKAKSSMVP